MNQTELISSPASAEFAAQLSKITEKSSDASRIAMIVSAWTRPFAAPRLFAPTIFLIRPYFAGEYTALCAAKRIVIKNAK